MGLNLCDAHRKLAGSIKVVATLLSLCSGHYFEISRVLIGQFQNFLKFFYSDIDPILTT